MPRPLVGRAARGGSYRRKGFEGGTMKLLKLALAGLVVGAMSPAVSVPVKYTFSGTFSIGSLSGTSFNGILSYDSTYSPYYSESNDEFYSNYSGFGSITYGNTTLKLDQATVYNDYPFFMLGDKGDEVVFTSSDTSLINRISFGPVPGQTGILNSTSLPDSLTGFTGGSFTIGNNSGAFSLNTAATPTVPEPATWAMMVAGFGLVGGALRRRGSLPALA